MHCELRCGDAKTPQLCLPFSHDPLNSGTKLLLQFRVLRLDLLQDGNVGVGVFPEGEKILIGGAGFRGVGLQDKGTGKAEVREGADGLINDYASPMDDFFKFHRSFSPHLSGEIRGAAHIDTIRSGLAELLMRLMEGSWCTPGVDILCISSRISHFGNNLSLT